MIRHIVIFTWRSDATAAEIAALAAALDSLRLAIPGLDLQHGPDLGYREAGNGDYALVARFADRADWDDYQAHPAHKAFVRDVAQPLQTHRIAIQMIDEAA